jgi:hypothetical protein
MCNFLLVVFLPPRVNSLSVLLAPSAAEAEESSSNPVVAAVLPVALPALLAMVQTLQRSQLAALTAQQQTDTDLKLSELVCD